MVPQLWRRAGSWRSDLTVVTCVAALLAPSVLLGARRPAHRPARASDTTKTIAPVASRDWSTAPAIVELDTDARIHVLGDVHGDVERLEQLLEVAGVLAPASRPNATRWTGANAVLVVTGDMIDKWPHGLDVLRLLRALEAGAAAAGGRVIVLLGNHEVEFLADPFAEKVSMFRAEIEAAGISLDDFARGRDPLGSWLRARPFAARVNDWFFSHAGQTHGRSRAELAAAIQDAIDHDGFATYELLRDDSLVEARLKPAPWWEGPGATPEASLDAHLRALGVRHVAFGHHPGAVRFADGSARARGEIHAYKGKIFLIDTGMSRGVGDTEGSLLGIERRQGTTETSSISADGSRRPLWRGE